MDLVRIISELRKERDAVDEVISQLERLAGNAGLRTAIAEVKARKPFTEATKKRMAAAQKKRWASTKADS
jgi:hypothetical protein